jgi:hypothetical protein
MLPQSSDPHGYSARDVAEWMVAQLEATGHLEQSAAVVDILEQFGYEYIYQNANGNLAISPKVLNAFAKLKGGRVEWHKWERAWKLLPDDHPASS